MSNELIGNFSNGAGLIGNLGNAGSGTNNYNDLVNKPSINGVTLAGNKSLTDLGINIPTKVSQLQNDSHYVQQSAIPTKTSQLQNDSGFAYAANLATVATTGSYNNLTDKPTIPTKTSQLQNDSNFVASSSLATVATTGSYDDLTNKPTIPAAQVNSDWNSNSGVSQILNKPNLAAVATSGSYDDLTNKPTIPAAQVNSDWNSNSGVSEILNKPTIPTNSDFSLSGLSDTTITTPTSGQVLAYDGSKWKNKSTSRTDITANTTFNETITGTNTKIFVKENVLYIFYQGESKSHSSDETLFTLPNSYKPSGNFYCTAMINAGGYGIIEIASGVAKLWLLNTASVSGRIYFTIAIPLA